MTSQSLNQFEGEARTSFLPRDILPGPGWAIYRAPAESFPCMVDHAPAEDREQSRCIRGFLVAISIEGAVGLLALALWRAWHLMIR